MIKKVVVSVVLLFSTLSLSAQNTDLLIGKWVFKDAYNKEKADAAGLAQLNSDIINKMTFEFEGNGNYKAYVMGENTAGKWIRTKQEDGFILNTLDGPFKFKILKLTKSELALKIGLGEFLMVKKN